MQRALSSLAVWPSRFSDEAAAAVMSCDEAEAHATLLVLRRHGLVLHDSLKGQHYLHVAVRSLGLSMAGPDARRRNEAALVTHVFAQLGTYGHMLQTPASALALQLSRGISLDISTAFDLILESNGSLLTPHLIKAVSCPSCGLAAFGGLLSDLGLLHSSDKALLVWRRLHLATKDGAEVLAAASSFVLSKILCAHGQFAEAEQLSRRALECIEVLGPEHPDTLASVSNHALLFLAQGRHAEAEPLLHRALVGSEKVLGPENFFTLASVSNLAFVFHSQGKHAEAEPLYRRALEGGEKVLGQDHSFTLLVVSNLAAIFQAQGRHAEAEPLVHRALEGNEKVLGPEHPQTLNSLNNLATHFLSQQGKHAEAEPLIRRALEGAERVLGPEQPFTLASVRSLVTVLCIQGKLAEAEALCRRALEAKKKVLGLDHPETLVTQEEVNSLEAWKVVQYLLKATILLVGTFAVAVFLKGIGYTF